jgi:probable rRNA maturation factor
MKIIVGIAKESVAWKQMQFVNVSLIRSVIKNVIKLLPHFVGTSSVEVAILLTSDDHMKRLNNEFLKKDYPTNVLSFPEVYVDPKRAIDFYPMQEYIYLGDIAFGYEIIAKEALESSKTFEQHFVHLLVHGVLHLLGFDHQEDGDMLAMQALEVSILEKLGIPSPY